MSDEPGAAAGEEAGEAAFIDRTLMFTDIEGSSRRWDHDTEAMRALMRHHDDLVSTTVERHDGVLGARTGDGAIALFERALDALHCALDLQARIIQGPTAAGLTTEPLQVRIGLHRGVVEPRGGEHYGPPMHRAARVMAAGHGGQVIVSSVVADELGAGPRELWEGCRLVDRGLHRLKGFHEAERLFEVVPTGIEPDPRGLRTTNTAGSMPAADIAAFVGREEEIERLLPELREGRLLTLVGTGGVGKTRLALQLGLLSRSAFPDGAWFVDLASISAPERVLPLLAGTLDIADESKLSLAEPVRRALGHRRMLVILDNCEHVLDGVASAIRAVTSDRMTATLLCTSQRDLGLAGELVEPIAPLAFDRAIEGSPAGRLFLLHAHRADRDLVLDASGIEALESICRRLDGLPLALELAAARVRVMSLAELAEQLQSRFDLLRSRDHHDRHRTMTAAISWSVELLRPEDRDALFELSVFRGSFDWQAAAAVTGRDQLDVVDILDELVRRSLLVRGPRGLRMLVPLRVYCAEALAASGRHDRVRARHAAWAAGSVPVPFDHVDPAVVAARIDQSVESTEDLHVAHTWLVSHDPAGAARLALALCEPWIARARSLEAMERLRDCDTDQTPPELRIEALGWFAAFGWTAGRNEEGEAAARHALQLAESNGLDLPAFAAVRLAVRLAFSNRIEEALALAEAAERRLRAGDGQRSRQFGPLAVVYAVAGDEARAVRLADEGVAAARTVGALRLLSALANRVLLQPGSEAVAAMSHEVANLARAVGRTSALAHAIAAIAHRARRQGDVGGFLAGVAQFADLMIDDEPTAVVGTLQSVPAASAATRPREAAVMLAAVESLAERHDHRGTDPERLRRAKVGERLRSVLGDQEFLRASAEGSAMGLAEAVDLLHWMADASGAGHAPSAVPVGRDKRGDVNRGRGAAGVPSGSLSARRSRS